MLKNCDCFQLTCEFKRSVRPLRELDFFRANELKLWFFYIGPVLFHSTVNEDLYDRFILLSYAIRLLMVSSLHANEAEKLIQSFLLQLKNRYSEEIFSPNVHALSHLAWQVRSFGPLWTASAMMFESANYLLQSKFTGTVNHLQLLVERCIRNKDSYRREIGDNKLAEFASKLRGKKRFFKQCLSSGIPDDIRAEGDVFYSNAKLSFFELDSLCHQLSRNSYISYRSNGRLRYGQIRVFSPQITLRNYRFSYWKLLKWKNAIKQQQRPLILFSFLEEPQK